MSGLADISLPKNDSLFMEFPPTLLDFPQQKTKHVSFRSPDPAFRSPPFSDFNEFEQLCKDYKDLYVDKIITIIGENHDDKRVITYLPIFRDMQLNISLNTIMAYTKF
jgi:hypothetical protein